MSIIRLKAGTRMRRWKRRNRPREHMPGKGRIQKQVQEAWKKAIADFKQDPVAAKRRRKKRLRAFPSFEDMSYAAYLRTPYWRRLRAAVLIRDKETCQICYVTRVQMHVHHRIYRKRGREKFEDLMTVCVTCHGRAHATNPDYQDFLFESQPPTLKAVCQWCGSISVP